MMVYGNVSLKNGDIVIMRAETMLDVLKRATEKYQADAVSMRFWTAKDEEEEEGGAVG